MATRHKTVVSISRNTLELSSSLAVLERISARTVGRPQCSPVIPNSSQKMHRGDPLIRALHLSYPKRTMEMSSLRLTLECSSLILKVIGQWEWRTKMGISSFQGEWGTWDLCEETREGWWDVSVGHSCGNFQVFSTAVEATFCCLSHPLRTERPLGTRSTLVLFTAVGCGPPRSLIWTVRLTHP